MTRLGAIEGVTLAEGVYRFMNVPYAEPPVGPRRFLPPIERSPWQGLWDGTRPGSSSAQAETWSPLHALGATPGQIGGDDVLNLNVYTPSFDKALPVAVFIHGGGFREGNAALPMYDGATFARDGIVTVSINYRIGAEGFLFIEGGHRNVGYADQVAALRWVQDNIAAFGGDPDQVTIFGHSVGGASVAHHLANPASQGLFHAAINQSGPPDVTVSEADSLAFSAALAAHLGIEPDLAAFGSITPDALLAAVQEIVGDVSKLGDSGDAYRLGPIPEPAVIPVDAALNPLNGFVSRVPVLGGFTSEEQLLFSWEDQPSGLDESEMLGEIEKLGPKPAALFVALRDVRPLLSIDERARKAVELQTFLGPIVNWLSAAKRAGLDVWGYEFGWRTNAFGGIPGAYHVLDIPFVFDHLDTTHALQMTGQDAPQNLADAMHGEWVEFMKRGRLERPQFTGIASMRWFDTDDRNGRGNTSLLAERFTDAAGLHE